MTLLGPEVQDFFVRKDYDGCENFVTWLYVFLASKQNVMKMSDGDGDGVWMTVM